MATQVPENMVLRTIYLPKVLDSRLRDLAFKFSLSKGEFIRLLVQEALERRAQEGERSIGQIGDAVLPAAPRTEIRQESADRSSPAKSASDKRPVSDVVKKLARISPPLPPIQVRAGAKEAVQAASRPKSQLRAKAPKQAKTAAARQPQLAGQGT